MSDSRNNGLCRAILRHRVGIRCGRGLGHLGCHRSVRPDPSSEEHVLVMEWWERADEAPVVVVEGLTAGRTDKRETPQVTKYRFGV